MVAGEASGDLLAGMLLGGLKDRWPALRSEGIGGPKMIAQDAYARRQYAHKHFGAIQRKLYLGATGLRHLLRAGGRATPRREGARLALRTMLGRVAPPFDAPPPTALEPAIPATSGPPLGREAANKSAPPQQPLFS